ncbi:uncharacterized protein LOC100366483 [Saccoglossus kowalevskii]|uniref:Cupin domain protein-like protein 340 n=1 Tax=Saccoglossus kowalevskii TaxID=10224 RepID=A0A1L7H7G2_SACKO|nr:PREDICTED: uncharacterized protein YML079W-like [Saccoglossus kowalevskii]APU50782.1 cupin domain protein-like protein 340 [Saccoglossus kowalevskii]
MDPKVPLNETLEVRNIINKLQLIPHTEGGYFKETYRSGSEPMASHGLTDVSGALMKPGGRRYSVRNVSTSIMYLLTKNSPIDFLHRDESDIVRYYHGGGTILVHTVSPDGKLHQHRLGINLEAGEVPQLVTPSGYWEALELVNGDWALQGESVAPGFDYRDMVLGTKETISHFSEDIRDVLQRCVLFG